MTVQELEQLSLPIDEADDATCLYIEAAIDWININTTLVIDKDDLVESVAALPAGARLFLCRYCEVMSADGTVASESIGGMSQSFNTATKTNLLYQLAKELIGKYLKGQVHSVPNVSKWV